MKVESLHDWFGVEVFDVDLAQVSATKGYPEIRELFEHHSLLLFRHQTIDDARHIRLGELFGPIEDRSDGANGPSPVVSSVSNVTTNDAVLDEQDMNVLQLKANQLWHTDSTFLPLHNEARSLRSICITARDCDGLQQVIP